VFLAEYLAARYRCGIQLRGAIPKDQTQASQALNQIEETSTLRIDNSKIFGSKFENLICWQTNFSSSTFLESRNAPSRV
jgi:hypothetical protein